MKFFDTEQEAWDYINADNKQYINKDGKTVEIAVVYEKPMPVLHRKEINPSNKVGIINCFEGKYALLSNETEIYDFLFLDVTMRHLMNGSYRMQMEILEYGIPIVVIVAVKNFSAEMITIYVREPQTIHTLK